MRFSWPAFIGVDAAAFHAAYCDEYVNWLAAVTPAFLTNATAVAQDDADNQYLAAQAQVNLQDALSGQDLLFTTTDAPDEAGEQEAVTDAGDDYQASVTEHADEESIGLAMADEGQDTALALAAAGYLLANAQADKDEAVSEAGGAAGDWQQERTDAKIELVTAQGQLNGTGPILDSKEWER